MFQFFTCLYNIPKVVLKAIYMIWIQKFKWSDFFCVCVFKTGFLFVALDILELALWRQVLFFIYVFIYFHNPDCPVTHFVEPNQAGLKLIEVHLPASQVLGLEVCAM